MPKDVNLLLYSGAISATGTTTPIDIVGGELATVHFVFTADASGGSETLDAVFQISLDGGSNYIDLITFPQFTGAANKGDAGSELAMVAYVPRADANPQARGVDTPVKARVSFTVGSGDTFTLRSYVSHLNSVASGSNAGFTSGEHGRYGPLDALAYWD